MSLSQLVKKHIDAAVAEAGDDGHPPDAVARTMLSFVIEIYRSNREADDIRAELQYAMDNLDPDQDYEFMRP
jgi:hypothetical protein